MDGETRPKFVILFFFVFFVVWKALIVGGWVAGGVEEKVLFRAG